MKPIIPWNAVKFFSNPGKYDVLDYYGNSPDFSPALRLDGSLSNPENWKGMREKSKLVTYNVWRSRSGYMQVNKAVVGSQSYSEWTLIHTFTVEE